MTLCLHACRSFDVRFFFFGGQLFFDDEWRNQEVEDLGTWGCGFAQVEIDVRFACQA